MRSPLLSILFFACTLVVGAQETKSLTASLVGDKTLIDDVKADPWQSLDTVRAIGPYDNIYSRALYSDSLSSSFAIFIKNEVKEHKHEKHSENIVVLDGEAVMKVDGKSFKIKKGDLIFVPKNTWHYVKVTSKIPLKVVSIQSPNFDGKDRIFKENK
jgi:mannose-6-phosphate isomerase-like protein (cupin superfamily)